MATFLVLVGYSYKIIIAVWRSAAAYDKSIWLAQLARIGIVLTVFAIWYPLLVK